MIKFTGGLDEFLAAKYPKEFVFISLGHAEYFTEEMKREYLDWYLKEYKGNIKDRD